MYGGQQIKNIYIYICAGEEGLKGYIVGRKE
jgi:hypothetical protein